MPCLYLHYHAVRSFHQFQQSFLFTRQLSSSIPNSDRQETCAAKISIEQIALRQVDQLQSLPKLTFDVEDADLAITPKHLQYIIAELLDYILKISQPKDFINIHGHIMNDEFHFYIDNREVSISSIPLEKISASIKFNPISNSDHELTTGLKIAKKIVEIHEGLFLIDNSDLTEAVVYVTLPLTRFITPSKPLLALVTNDEL